MAYGWIFEVAMHHGPHAFYVAMADLDAAKKALLDQKIPITKFLSAREIDATLYTRLNLTEGQILQANVRSR
jgi:hypothetical protein